MAKRIVKWTLVGSVLNLAKALEDPKATAEILTSFDLAKLFPTFGEMNEVQKQLIVYGTKQKLMDVGANAIAEVAGKVEAAKKKYDELLAGKWEGERVNATGTSENKRIASAAKELASAVTMDGLMMKKALSTFPGQPAFTPEDQAKLDELTVAAGEILKRQANKGKGK